MRGRPTHRRGEGDGRGETGRFKVLLCWHIDGGRGQEPENPGTAVPEVEKAGKGLSTVRSSRRSTVLVRTGFLLRKTVSHFQPPEL